MLHTCFTNTLSSNQRKDSLTQSMCRDRHTQFCDRLGWNLNIRENGIEIDEYDDRHTTYVVVSNHNVHLGSFRLRPVQYGTMISDHFSKELPVTNRLMQQNDTGTFEITRLLCKRNLTMNDRSVVMSLLAEGFDQAWRELQCGSVAGVVFPAIFRLICRAGFAASVIENKRVNDKDVISFQLQKSTRSRTFLSRGHETVSPAVSIFQGDQLFE